MTPWLIAVLLLRPSAARAGEIDLTRAVVVAPARLSTPEEKAVAMLVEEVQKRTSVRWNVLHQWPADSTWVVAVGQASEAKDFAGPFGGDFSAGKPLPAEGYEILTATAADGKHHSVLIVGNDERGVLFGVGKLLRELEYEPEKVLLPAALNVRTAPELAVRGHQFSYTPQSNTYDGWDLPQWEQYVRDIAVFGANTVEVVAPRPDNPAGPLFPRPAMDMTVGISRLARDYGLDVSVWSSTRDRDPANPKAAYDYSDPKKVASSVAEWSEVFQKMPRIDALFVPGGDPGRTEPRYFLPFVEKQAESLRRYHPRAQVWVSPQGFTQDWLNEFYALLKKEKPAWLTGVVYGPQIRESLAQVRASLPTQYAIRLYPDITHSVRSQFGVPDWDPAFEATESRETINPRPLDETTIFQASYKATVGFVSYSEGVNDDVNKAVWSALGWDPKTSASATLRQYGNYFIGSERADDFAQGLLALERNWRGPLADNAGVDATLARFQTLERNATPQDLGNWRFQQALYRAYYDAYERKRLIRENESEEQALKALRDAPSVGSSAALDRAEKILDRGVPEQAADPLRARVFALGRALYDSVRMQLSVPLYHASGVERGATLDTIDAPLNDRPWLKARFAEVRRLTDEKERLAKIAALANWTDPGPGGFYDDLGDPAHEPHLVKGPDFDADPSFLKSVRIDYDDEPSWRQSWRTEEEALYDAPLRTHYDGLDRSAQYKVRVVYAQNKSIRLDANGIQVHPLMKTPAVPQPLEFDVPKAATASGHLTLTWKAAPGLGDNGRVDQVCEVWLIKE